MFKLFELGFGAFTRSQCARNRFDAESCASEKLDNAIVKVASKGQARASGGAFLDGLEQSVPLNLLFYGLCDKCPEFDIVDGKAVDPAKKQLARPGLGADGMARPSSRSNS